MIEITNFSATISHGCCRYFIFGRGPDSTIPHNEDTPNRTRTRPRSLISQGLLFGNVGVWQEVDVSYQLLRLSCSARGEPVWNVSNWNILSQSFLRRILKHSSFETLRCLHNILDERKVRSRMGSTITCVKSELAGIPDGESSPSSVLICRKRACYFFPAEIWSASLPSTLMSPSPFPSLW
jgi:hypothetical protein